MYSNKYTYIIIYKFTYIDTYIDTYTRIYIHAYIQVGKITNITGKPFKEFAPVVNKRYTTPHSYIHTYTPYIHTYLFAVGSLVRSLLSPR